MRGSRLHAGPPNADSQLLGGPPPRPSRQTYQSLRRAPRDVARFLEPFVTVRGVIEDDVDHDANPAPVRLGKQPIEIREGAEQRIDPLVIADVIPEVDLRRRIERRDPDRVDAEILQIRQTARDAVQVADAVAVRVLKAADVHLIETARRSTTSSVEPTLCSRAYPIRTRPIQRITRMFSALRGHSLAPRPVNQGGQNEANRNLRSDRVWMCHGIGGARRRGADESARPAGRIRRYSSEPEQPGQHRHADGMPRSARTAAAAPAAAAAGAAAQPGAAGGASYILTDASPGSSGSSAASPGSSGAGAAGTSGAAPSGAAGTSGSSAAGRSGSTYALEGTASELSSHVNKRVQVTGTMASGSSSSGIGQQLGRGGHVGRGHAWRGSGKLRRVGERIVERSAALQGDQRS